MFVLKLSGYKLIYGGDKIDPIPSISEQNRLLSYYFLFGYKCALGILKVRNAFMWVFIAFNVLF